MIASFIERFRNQPPMSAEQRAQVYGTVSYFYDVHFHNFQDEVWWQDHGSEQRTLSILPEPRILSFIALFHRNLENEECATAADDFTRDHEDHGALPFLDSITDHTEDTLLPSDDTPDFVFHSSTLLPDPDLEHGQPEWFLVAERLLRELEQQKQQHVSPETTIRADSSELDDLLTRASQFCIPATQAEHDTLPAALPSHIEIDASLASTLEQAQHFHDSLEIRPSPMFDPGRFPQPSTLGESPGDLDELLRQASQFCSTGTLDGTGSIPSTSNNYGLHSDPDLVYSDRGPWSSTTGHLSLDDILRQAQQFTNQPELDILCTEEVAQSPPPLTSAPLPQSDSDVVRSFLISPPTPFVPLSTTATLSHVPDFGIVPNTLFDFSVGDHPATHAIESHRTSFGLPSPSRPSATNISHPVPNLAAPLVTSADSSSPSSSSHVATPRAAPSVSMDSLLHSFRALLAQVRLLIRNDCSICRL